MTKDLLPVRLSHLLSHAGVGAIVRGPKGFVVVQDIRQWTTRNGEPGGAFIPYVERVRAVLGVSQELRQPPLATLLKQGIVDGVCVPATRFPFWMRCPERKCGALYFKPWREDNLDEDEPRCQRQQCTRKPRLEQVPWVLADSRGFLSDVPWAFLTHRESKNPTQSQCKKEDQLRLCQEGDGRYKLRCDACNCSAMFRAGEPFPFGVGRSQPWRSAPAAPAQEPPNEELAQVVAINDARVHAAETDIALVIPPESRARKGTPVDLLYRSSQDRARIERARNDLSRKSAMQALARQYRCTLGDIEGSLDELQRGYPTYGAVFTPGMVAEDEYASFADEPPDLREDEDFVPRNRSDAWITLLESNSVAPAVKAMAAPVKQLIRIDRLKAVKVFQGFRRPIDDDATLVPPFLAGESTWLPAIELYGEGVFIALDEARLSAWEEQPVVQRRLARLAPRFEQTGGQQSGRHEAPNPLTARFMLLHTLSHLLMRQIESEGGYPAASLCERIYCGTSPTPMAGILIWVGVPDIAGSLGGLAELAEPDRFLRILIRAIEHARWCSLDPVCGEHEGQGPALLNRAACHACTLVPEPACNHGNTLLDRGFVRGDPASGLPSLFGDS